MNLYERFYGLPPGLQIILSFSFLIVVGTLLLLLPISTPPDKTLSLTNAVFTATSAVCVTGLIVVQTPLHFTAFGQLVILVLFQIGGLGIIFASTLIFMGFQDFIGMEQRFTFQNTFMNWPFRTVRKAFLRVLVLFFGLEVIGAGILTTQFMEDHGFRKALWHGIFHSVSAICNAGFSLNTDSLVSYQHNPTVVLTVATLIVFGGIGFVVIAELLKVGTKQRQWTLHTRTMLLGTLLFLSFGTVLFLLLEPNSGVLEAFFQSVTARTAGFNTVDLAAWGTPSAIVFMFLMFVGAGPASTAGGIKITTFFGTLADVVSRMKQRENTHWLNRRLPAKLVNNSVVLFGLALFVAGSFTFLLTITETAPLEVILFEVFSALGTVGLSLGITPELSTPGKWIIIVAMFIGRLGPLTFALLIINEQDVEYTYPEEDLLIG
jgi:trk system potassium uptake protein TrkH